MDDILRRIVAVKQEEIAALRPRDGESLGKVRALGPNFVKGKMGESLLAALAKAATIPPEQWPSLPRRDAPPRGLGAKVELLRVLLKRRCETHDVAAKMIATGDDLDQFALNPTPDHPLMQGWRFEVFGRDAQRLLDGKLALTLVDGEVQEITVG